MKIIKLLLLLLFDSFILTDFCNISSVLTFNFCKEETYYITTNYIIYIYVYYDTVLRRAGMKL